MGIQDDKLVLFQSKQMRRAWHENEWSFSVVDIVEVLTESPSPRQYWGVLKQRESQLLTICLQLKLESTDGKKYETDCVNTKNAFRLIQSIPSKKAEPFKMWLAEVGKERLDEIENPELAQERMKELYEKNCDFKAKLPRWSCAEKIKETWNVKFGSPEDEKLERGLWCSLPYPS